MNECYSVHTLPNCVQINAHVFALWTVAIDAACDSDFWTCQDRKMYLFFFNCCLVAQLCLPLCDPMDCSTPGFPVLHHLPEFTQTHVHWWCHPTVSSSVVPFSHLQSFPASGSFPESVLRIRWPKYWSFSVSPSNEYSGLISFRIDWFDLLAVQETLKSLLQHHSSKASIFQCSAFFTVQLISL